MGNNFFDSDQFKAAVKEKRTQKALGQDLGVTQQQASKYMAQGDSMTISTFIKICNLLGLKAKKFFKLQSG